MKRMLLSFIVIVTAFSCKQSKDQALGDKNLPPIAIAGLAIESSTISPALTDEDDFHARVADDIFSFYPFCPQIP